MLEAWPARTTELGSITIRRALPRSRRRMVGPWCFFDRYGPLTFQEGKPMDVAPHPHMGLQTVSWLLSGEVIHHDSLGCEGLVRPGELNLMTAGRGIAHSEETPARNSGTLNGVQLWVALPDADRHTAPSFHHHMDIPQFDLPGGHAALIMGDFAGYRSPGAAFSPMTGADLSVHAGSQLLAPLATSFEHAIMMLEGDAVLSGEPLAEPLAMDTLYYLGTGRGELAIDSRAGARIMLLGGAPFGEQILMWWNFVARTQDELAAARDDWREHRRFEAVTAYRGPRVEAPDFVPRPAPR